MSTRETDRIDPALVSALGRLVLEHAALEEALRDSLLIHACDKVAVGVLVSGLSFSTLVEKFGAVYYEHAPPRRPEIQTLCKQLHTLNERRNQYIHTFWRTDPGVVDPVRYSLKSSSKKGLVLQATGVPPAEVESLVTELYEATQKLWEIAIEMTFPITDPATG